MGRNLCSHDLGLQRLPAIMATVTSARSPTSVDRQPSFFNSLICHLGIQEY